MNRAQRLAWVIGGTIRDMGDDGAPSGVIFGGLQGECTFSEYNAIVNFLIKSRLVEKRNHVLYWVGPAKGEKKADDSAV